MNHFSLPIKEESLRKLPMALFQLTLCVVHSGQFELEVEKKRETEEKAVIFSSVPFPPATASGYSTVAT